jgi:transcriptional regulator with XRE-family HTH domain
VKAWRHHKRLTLQALADAAGLSKPYVSQIEGSKRAGTAATLRKLASWPPHRAFRRGRC